MSLDPQNRAPPSDALRSPFILWRQGLLSGVALPLPFGISESWNNSKLTMESSLKEDLWVRRGSFCFSLDKGDDIRSVLSWLSYDVLGLEFPIAAIWNQCPTPFCISNIRTFLVFLVTYS